MSWRDLKPLDERYELEQPTVSEGHYAERGVPGFPFGGHVTLDFSDELSREWFAEWCRSKRGWIAFMCWVDEKR